MGWPVAGLGVRRSMNIDEVDFIDQGSGSPAFMHLRESASGGISIRLDIVNIGDFDLSVSVEDARRLGERLVVAANDIIAK